jgi:beta-lactamase superfamily II metal-dependent hydrolase
VQNRGIAVPGTVARPARAIVLPLVLLACSLLTAGSLAAQSRNLDIYWIDVEGGGATLVVAPSGESLLIDTGFARPDDRDAKRIHAVAQDAGLKQIDHHMVTHFHGDHVGGLTALSKMIPIVHFYGHGGKTEGGDFGKGVPGVQEWMDIYQKVSGGKGTILKLGDKIPLKGVQVQVITANREFLAKPVNGGGAQNPLCANAEHKPLDSLENQRNIATLFTYGRFRYFNPGDTPWETEMELSCPVNKLGTVTVYQTTKHGAWDGGGAPAHLYALKPQVVVVTNGPNKGLGIPGGRGHYERIAGTPGIEGIWQGHMSPEGKDHNAPEEMIANLDSNPDHKPVHYIKASVAQDGTFTITNTRNGLSRKYTTR